MEAVGPTKYSKITSFLGSTEGICEHKASFCLMKASIKFYLLSFYLPLFLADQIFTCAKYSRPLSDSS